MAATKLYVFDNGPSAARVLQRPALRALVEAGFSVLVACNRDDGYLFEDLVGQRLQLLRGKLPASSGGSLIDLAAACPQDHVPIDLSLARYRDTQAPQWRSVATALNRQLRAHGVAFALDEGGDAPMLDFAASHPGPELPRPTIYLDTRSDASGETHFVFDLPRLLALAPEFDFWCTQRPPFVHAALRDGSSLDLVQHALVSERCVLLLGVTCMPFAVTLTEANRHKPKAVCGHDRYLYSRFWDYPGNPLEYLATMEQLADFVRSNLTAMRGRAALAAAHA